MDYCCDHIYTTRKHYALREYPFNCGYPSIDIGDLVEVYKVEGDDDMYVIMAHNDFMTACQVTLEEVERILGYREFDMDIFF